MKTCKCEHWQICPVCMPHRFDEYGTLLPPEQTPLQAALQEAESLREQLKAVQAKRDELLAALKESVDLIETIVPLEGATVRKARAAIAKGEKT